MPAMTMLHEKDPRRELLDKIGGLDDVEVMNAHVLVAVYVRPEKTKSGIIVTDQTRGEDKYQGKVGLIVKLGPLAFQDDDKVQFATKLSEGDWIVLRTSDGWPLSVNQTDCRMIADTDIKLRIQSPDQVF